jgi:hypothetical protein
MVISTTGWLISFDAEEFSASFVRYIDVATHNDNITRAASFFDLWFIRSLMLMTLDKLENLPELFRELNGHDLSFSL